MIGAKAANSRLIPWPAKAISSSISSPLPLTLTTVPVPQALWETLANYQPKTKVDVPFAKKPVYRKPAGTVEKSQGTGAEKKQWNIGDKVSHKAWGTGTVVFG